MHFPKHRFVPTLKWTSPSSYSPPGGDLVAANAKGSRRHGGLVRRIISGET